MDPHRRKLTENRMNRSAGALPVVLLLCFLIAVGLGLYALVTLRDHLIEERGADLARTAARVADTLDRVLFERFGDIRLFAEDSIIRVGARGEQVKRLQEYKAVYWYYEWIGVTDATGRVVAETESDPVAATGRHGATGPSQDRPDGALRDVLERVRQSKQVHVSEPQRAPAIGGGPSVSFSAPILGQGGELLGMVTSTVPLGRLWAIVDRGGGVSASDDAYDWLVLDRRGAVLSEKGHAQDLDGEAGGLDLPSTRSAAEAPGKPGFAEEWDPARQKPVVTGYAKTRGFADFPGLAWTILVRLDRERVYAPVDRIVWTVGAMGLLVVAPLTGFGMWTARRLVQEQRALVRARQALEESVNELTRSNAELEQFAYVASHDLQEPLRMVASYTQLLARRYRGKLDPDADEFIAYAIEGATRMQSLIQDLLAYSRVNSQGRAFEETDCHTLLEHVLNNLRAAIEESRAVVTADRLPTVRADERQLLQLFQNLIDNAMKFRGDQPPIVHVSAVREGSEWVFSVRDNGIGIDLQYADRIFAIFQRLHSRDQYPGTGIGLAICKKIVERHGGRIWVASQADHGATFYFTLPIPDASRSP